MNRDSGGGWLMILAFSTLHCGSADTVDPEPLVIEQQTDGYIEGRYSLEGAISDTESSAGDTDEALIEFSSTSTSALSGDVAIRMRSLMYELHYDYDGREVVSDGHDGALDRETQLRLHDALERVGEHLGKNDPTLPLHEQMLFAALALLEDSAGMPLPRMTFALDPAEVDKSLDDDGVTCIERGTTYGVSFDFGSTVVADEPITSNASDCNGQCGPGCTRLTPWAMWTLDCLEHDTCCGDTDSNVCWTPLGECGDEYIDASTDFLQGFDPFFRHCDG